MLLLEIGSDIRLRRPEMIPAIALEHLLALACGPALDAGWTVLVEQPCQRQWHDTFGS